jgi:hypothetical protein
MHLLSIHLLIALVAIRIILHKRWSFQHDRGRAWASGRGLAHGTRMVNCSVCGAWTRGSSTRVRDAVSGVVLAPALSMRNHERLAGAYPWIVSAVATTLVLVAVMALLVVAGTSLSSSPDLAAFASSSSLPPRQRVRAANQDLRALRALTDRLTLLGAPLELPGGAED